MGSETDPDARLYRKANGQSSRLCYMGHLLLENRNTLIVDAALTRAGGSAEREAALAMLGRREESAADHAVRDADFEAIAPTSRLWPHCTRTGSAPQGWEGEGQAWRRRP